MKKAVAAWGAREVGATLGLGMIAGGLAMVSISLALVVTGTLLLGLAILPLMGRRKSE